jgi:hypothetical protein
MDCWIIVQKIDVLGKHRQDDEVFGLGFGFDGVEVFDSGSADIL